MGTSNEVYEKMLAQLSIEDLELFQQLVETAISEKIQSENKKPTAVRFNPYEHFERDWRGWTSTMLVQGFNDELSDWSAFGGKFMQGCREHYQVGRLYLDRGMSRQKETYTFFQVDTNGQPVVIRTVLAEDFSPELLEFTQKYL